MPMLNTRLLICAVASVIAASSVVAAPMNKCVVNGTVTYQQGPCSADQAAKRPSLEELNAEVKARRAAAATATTTAAAASLSAPRERIATTVPTEPNVFSCDARQYCSQMRSCEEAKYFLANCPRAKMDGDKNGIPCEKQWCNR
jgi:hypothetical protein